MSLPEASCANPAAAQLPAGSLGACLAWGGSPPSRQRAPAAPDARPRGVPTRHPVHPGRLLERLVLRPLSLSQTETARQLGISRRRVNELVQGQRAMSPDTAIRCALAFGLDVSFWLGLQARWDSYHHWHALRRAQAQPAAGDAVRPARG